VPQGEDGMAVWLMAPVCGTHNDRTRCGQIHLSRRVSMAVSKKRWISPEIRRFGTFETATQGCDKTWGSTDGFTMQGQAIVCAGS